MFSKNDIINSVKNLDKFIKVNDLKGAKIKANSKDQPFFYTGGFNMVFQLITKDKVWAFRVWHINIQNLKERFQQISSYLTSKKLYYFADFIYDEKGLLVNGELVDTIRMEWLDGLLLKNYIELNLHNKQSLKNLAHSFLEMCKQLHASQISHGDLQHGNIIIDSDEKIRLIDYDSICVPDIEGKEEFVTGLKGYQHPSRINTKGSASLKADYFSEAIIYLSILAISERPKLWDTFQVADSEDLLFNEDDYQNIQHSKIYKELCSGFSDETNSILNILTEVYLNKKSYLELEPFYTYLEPPKIEYFQSNRDLVINGLSVELTWLITGYNKIYLSDGKGEVEVTGLGKCEVKPKVDSTYKLKVKGYFGEVESNSIEIRVFPVPMIKTINVPSPQFTNTVFIKSINISSPTVNTTVKADNLFFRSSDVEFSKLSQEAKEFMKKKKNSISISNIFDMISNKVNKSIFNRVKKKIK